MENRWSPGQVNVRNGVADSLGATARLTHDLRVELKPGCHKAWMHVRSSVKRSISMSGRARIELSPESDYLLMMINNVPTFVSTMMMPLSISEADLFGM